MKPVWKWIVGILAALVVLGLLGTPLMMAQFGGYGMMRGGRFGWDMPMRRGYWGGGWPMMPMMGGYGGMGIGMLLSWLIQLGVLVLIILGIIWLVRAINRQDRNSSQ